MGLARSALDRVFSRRRVKARKRVARQARFSVLPQTRQGGRPVIELGEANGERVRWILTRDGLGRATHSGCGPLTPQTLGHCGRRQKNDARAHSCPRALVELTKFSRFEPANLSTRHRSMKAVTGASPNDTASALNDTANAGRCPAPEHPRGFVNRSA
ncbi:hypothetical protein AB870_24805 (plasmid) [Pandoraea faecigallinarum]|uniref:Uncharacterized protein n=1 Tax=Pandoraea faecigallinarum TaxID=656179 RepID=A0A0H3X0B0_9BURK|nr:hypothetical protein [Pandoraea faecigallinarum]AKM33402.1 hypothetical protein AB870_24805 [Pandoraea faecigallinarum]